MFNLPAGRQVFNAQFSFIKKPPSQAVYENSWYLLK
jgi:hypothetical protein